MIAASTAGFTLNHSASAALVTEMKSLPRNTPSTPPTPNRARASGERPAVSAVRKSAVPADITICPGMNFRVDGLGVSSVWMNMGDALRYGRFYLHESRIISQMGAGQ